MRTNCRPSARAMERPSDVFPTPGGPTRQRIGPSSLPTSREHRDVVENAVLHVGEPVVVLVEYLSRMAHVEHVVAALGPRQGEEPVEVVARRRSPRERSAPCARSFRNLAQCARLHRLREPLRLDLRLELLDVVALVLAELAMDRLELLLQVELALVLEERARALRRRSFARGAGSPISLVITSSERVVAAPRATPTSSRRWRTRAGPSQVRGKDARRALVVARNARQLQDLLRECAAAARRTPRSAPSPAAHASRASGASGRFPHGVAESVACNTPCCVVIRVTRARASPSTSTFTVPLGRRDACTSRATTPVGTGRPPPARRRRRDFWATTTRYRSPRHACSTAPSDPARPTRSGMTTYGKTTTSLSGRTGSRSGTS